MSLPFDPIYQQFVLTPGLNLMKISLPKVPQQGRGQLESLKGWPHLSSTPAGSHGQTSCAILPRGP